MSHALPRHCHTHYPRVARGEGCYVFDSQGRRYLDGCGGAAVSCLGHNHAGVIDAIKHQLDDIPFSHTGFFHSESAEQLAQKLVGVAPGNLSHAYFTCGGSEAMEAALKMAYQYHVERGEPQRTAFISRRQSYHGNTLGALSVAGNPARRTTFSPILSEAHHIAPCFAFRYKDEQESSQAYALRAAQELEERILMLGAENVAAYVAEPVVGATAGAVCAEPGYFSAIRRICDRHGVLLIADEVMCGTGRTGYFYAMEAEGAQPDIVTMAKGLSAGYVPLGAVMLSSEIEQCLRLGSGLFRHGHTFTGHPLGCAAGSAALDIILPLVKEGIVMSKGQQLRGMLESQFGEHPHVGDIRGRGLFLALELVAERDTNRPFATNTGLHEQIRQSAMQHGLMCYPAAGTVDGKSGHHILLAPPFIMSSEQMEELVEKLALSMEHALAGVCHAA